MFKDSMDVKNQNDITTVQIQKLAAIDTTIYKIVEVGDNTYCVNPKINLVEKKIPNDTGLTKTLFLFIHPM